MSRTHALAHIYPTMIHPSTTSNFDFSLENADVPRHMGRKKIIYHRVRISTSASSLPIPLSCSFSLRSFVRSFGLFNIPICHAILLRCFRVYLRAFPFTISHFRSARTCIRSVCTLRTVHGSSGTQSNCLILRR